MSNLMKAEFYRLWRMKSFWGILAVSLILGSLLMLDQGLPSSAAGCISSSLYSMPLLYFLVMIFGALFIGDDFASRTLQNRLCAGHKRGAVLISKTLSYLTASTLILVTPLTCSGLLGMLLFGPADLHPATPLLFQLVSLLLMLSAMGMFPLLAAFLFRDVGLTLAVPIGIFFLMIFFLNGSNGSAIAGILPIGQIRLLSLGQLTAPFLQTVLTDVIWILACYILSFLAFRGAELK